MSQNPPRRRAVPSVAAAALLVLSTAAIARARPPAADSPARYIPSDDLIAYAEFDGLGAHDDAWKKTAAFRLLNETSLGRMLEDILGQLGDRGLEDAKVKLTGAEVVKSVEHILRSGFAAGVNGSADKPPGVVIVLRGAAREDSRALFQRLAEAHAAGGKVERDRQGGRDRSTARIAGRPWCWWAEKEDLVLVTPVNQVGDEADRVLAAIEGTRPNAAGHPIRAELFKDADGFEPAAIAFLDMAKVPAPPDAAKSGLDGLKRLDFRWGFQDDALLTIYRAIAPKPRKGFLALLDQPTFDVKGLPPIPADLHGFTAFSIDPEKAFDTLAAVSGALDPRQAEAAAQAEKEVKEKLGVRLREDLLARLGPRAAFYARIQPPLPGLAPMLAPEATAVVQIDDPGAIGKTLGVLMERINKEFKAQFDARPPGRPGAEAPLEFKKAAGPGMSYALAIPRGLLPPGPFAALKPTVTVGRHHLVIASTPAAAGKALAIEAKPGAQWTPQGEFKPMAGRLPGGLLMLNVSDPRDELPNIVAALPMLLQALDAQFRAAQPKGGPPARGFPVKLDPDVVPKPEELRERLFPGSFAVAVDDESIRVVTRESIPSVGSPASSGIAVALLLPAVQAAREAARRAQCVNNLKQIGLALINYHDANNTYPPAAIVGKDGKPLLSWRVAILPYIERQDLYAKFHLDEPWDSEHNQALIDSMPATYACPSTPRPAPGTTTYRVLAGKGTAFEGAEGHAVREFLDGTSMTLLVVEAPGPVPWTKPDELAFDPDPAKPLPKLGSPHAGGFNALFADGSVHFLKKSIAEAVLRALCTRNGNEAVEPGSF